MAVGLIPQPAGSGLFSSLSKVKDPSLWFRTGCIRFSTDEDPGWSVVMGLTLSKEMVPNYGMGLITYVCDEGVTLRQTAGLGQEDEAGGLPRGPK